MASTAAPDQAGATSAVAISSVLLSFILIFLEAAFIQTLSAAAPKRLQTGTGKGV
jgi:hypothetical protein